MKKVIHFSDVHIGYEDMHQRFHDVIRNMSMIKQPAGNYVIVITGDIVDSATNDNYRTAKECLDILTGHGYLVLVAPGNHDYGTGNLADKKWVNRFKRWFFGTDQIDYPKLDVIDGIAFICLDSMQEELGTWDRRGASGELGKEQLNSLDAMLGSSEVQGCEKTVVYMHHHPLDPIPQHELKDAKKLYDVLIKYQVDALLFGHLHHGKKWNGWCNIPRTYDAGTTTMKRGSPGPHRVMDLTRNAALDYDGDFHGDYATMSELSLPTVLRELICSRVM